jgi:hypothetical protein
LGLGIDVEVRSEFLRKMLFVGSSTNRNGTQTHFPRKLHAQVAKSAHALDGNRVAGTRGVTERVEGRDAGHNCILAVCGFTAAAGLAGSVFTSEKSNSDTLADLPSRDASAHFFYTSDDLVARNTRIGKVGELCFHRCCIRMAYAASLDADSHLSGAGDGKLSLDQGKNTR